MTLFHVLILAIIQGVTEFLPVSSSAHLIFPSKILGWPDQGIEYDVALHLGTLAAIILYFYKDLKEIAKATFITYLSFRPSRRSRLGFAVIIATIPACIVGGFVEKYISTSARTTVHLIAILSIFYGLILAYASYFNTKKEQQALLKNPDENPLLEKVSYTHALIIGLAQALSLVPGTSRSGVTISAALFLGIKVKTAAYFSFLMSIPIVLASAVLEIHKLYISGQYKELPYLELGLGAFISFVVGLGVVHIFFKVISNTSIYVFVGYRLLLGLTLLILF